MVDYQALALKYNTPLFVYDFDYIQKQFLKLKNSFKSSKSIMAYAIKANSNLSVLKHIANLGGGADCVSINELRRAIKAGIPTYKIILSGVGKRDDEIKEAIESNILFINIESFEEIRRVETIAKELNIETRISVRINPNIDPKTHSYISTGMHENKFGVDIDEAYKIYFFAKKSKYLNPIGIHFHIGSQLTKLSPILEASQIVSSMVKKLKKADIDISFFDVGGGIGIKYNDEETINVLDYAKGIIESVRGLDVTIITEMGRFLLGNSGVFLTKVLYEKSNSKKRFVIVDGAMNDLIRPSLYGAYHDIQIVGENDTQTSKADIVGPVCESGDFFAKDIDIKQTKHNDLLIIKSAGAYCFSLSSNYNSRCKSAEIALIDGKDKIIRDREVFSDLTSHEIKYLNEDTNATK